MLCRMLVIVISSWLPALAVILPIDAAHRANGLVAGIAATVLSALSLVDLRARFGAALLLETVLAVSSGVTMFSWLIGPFSQSPHVTWVKATAAAVAATPAPEVELPRAA